jgi:hypothetical protein
MTFQESLGANGGRQSRPASVRADAGISSQDRGHSSLPSLGRVLVRGALILAAAAFTVFAPYGVFAQHSSAPAPHVSAPPAPQPHASPPASHGPSEPHPQKPGPAYPNSQPHPPGQQHLDEWMKKNNGLPPDQQVKRLQQEPGYGRLTPQQQQKVTNRLEQLNGMPPQLRQRYLERIENMERLSPQQQQQVRGSARMLGQMAPERQQAVKDAMRGLLNVPPGQRQAELNSSKYSNLSPEERGIAGNLLSVEPYHPPSPPQ